MDELIGKIETPIAFALGLIDDCQCLHERLGPAANLDEWQEKLLLVFNLLNRGIQFRHELVAFM